MGAFELSPANIHVPVLAASIFAYVGRTVDAVTMADRALRLDPQMGPANRTAIKDACSFARASEKAIEVHRLDPRGEGFVFARRPEQDLFVDAFRTLGLPVCAKPEELAAIANARRLPDCTAS